MTHRFLGNPATPGAQALGDALSGSAPLALLLRRHRESQARLDCVAAQLPSVLVPHVRAGPLDDEAWTLLAANSAVAAKLRQLAPAVEDALREGGWPQRTLRIRICPP